MIPMGEPVRRADGNEEVIKLLERWLARAKEQGQIAFITVVACENYRHVVSDSAGSLHLAFTMNWGLDTAKYQLLVQTHSRHEEPFQGGRGSEADRICYDISKGPACFDWIAWLILAEMNRIREGGLAPLKVGFKMFNSSKERELHERERAPFYKNVIFPSLGFVGAVADQGSNEAPTMEKYTLRPIVELAMKGEKVPLLQPSKTAVKAVEEYLYSEGDRRPPVTITLREVKNKWEFRNSNLDEWFVVAEHLARQGERVIFVRDTGRAEEALPGFQTCPAASLDINVRLALYESAKCNLFVSNGPWMLGLHGSRPWLMFVKTDSMSPFFPETPQFWVEWHGIHPGDQFPWSTPEQRIIWDRDNADTVIRAWNAMWPLAAAAE